MQSCYNTDPRIQEIALDEVGRGCLFGRVYAAAVLLPHPDSDAGRVFQYDQMKDSKKIKNKKKMAELSQHIKDHALAYSIQFREHTVIDQVNILQANMQAMHACVQDIFTHTDTLDRTKTEILVDGNYFKPFCLWDDATETLIPIPHTTMEQGDAKYQNIAAASILAKHARDSYILDVCRERPELAERYGLDTNMGYGTKKHLDGIRAFGLVDGHRLSFAPCKNYV